MESNLLGKFNKWSRIELRLRLFYIVSPFDTTFYPWVSGLQREDLVVDVHSKVRDWNYLRYNRQAQLVDGYDGPLYTS